jgi:hypothetical protein
MNQSLQRHADEQKATTTRKMCLSVVTFADPVFTPIVIAPLMRIYRVSDETTVGYEGIYQGFETPSIPPDDWIQQFMTPPK